MLVSQEGHFYNLPDLFVVELNVLRASIFNTEGKISDLCKSVNIKLYEEMWMK